MGPQQLLADAFRSVNLDSPTAARLRAEAPASRFDNYLDEASAPRDGASASDESEQAARPEDDAQNKSEAPTDEAQAESEVAVVASSAVVQSQALQVVSAQAQVSSGVEATEQSRSVGRVDAAAEAPRAGSGASSATDAPAARADGPDAGDSRISMQRTTAPVVETPNSPAAESSERTQVRDPNSSQQRDASIARPNGETSEGRSDRGADRLRAGEKRPVEVNHAEPVKAVAVDTKREGVERVDPQAQTVHQRKVEAWLADRRESSGEQRQDTGRHDNDGLGNRARVSKLPALLLDKGDTVRHLRPTVASGHGDGPAAAVARFLVEGAAKVDAPSAVDVSTSPVARPTLSSQAVPVATSNVVGDLLTARVEGADSIDGAARLLASSGSQGRHQVTMRLDPPEMGQMRLAIRMQQQDMTLRVEAQTQSVVKLIESRLGELREALATQGIRVDRADVVVRAPASGEANGHMQREPGQGSTGQPAADGGAADFLGGDPAHTPSDEANRESWAGSRGDGALPNEMESADHEAVTNEERTPATESLVDLVA